MAAPAFVNQGSLASFANVSSVTVNLPTSRVIGNLMIAWILQSNPAVTFTPPSGWTSLASWNGPKGVNLLALAWRVIDGTESGTMTWAGAGTGFARIVQISGQATPWPFGACSFVSDTDVGHTGGQLRGTPFATSNTNSMILAFLDADNGSALTLPSPYTQISNDNGFSFVSTMTCYETISGAYTLCDSISQNYGTSNDHWATFLLEIIAATSETNPEPPVFELGWINSAPYTDVSSLTSTGSFTGTLPSWRQTGDLLIAVAQSVNASISFTWPAGWTPFASVNGAGMASMSAAYAFVTGSETAPTVTLSSSNTGRIDIAAIRGVSPGHPIGAISTNGGTNTSISCSAITTLRNNSLILGMMVDGTPSTSAPLPSSGYVQNQNLAPGGCGIQYGWETRQTAGSSSDALSASNPGGNWAAMIFEVPGAAHVRGWSGIMG